jgi:hypothetical protein
MAVFLIESQLPDLTPEFLQLLPKHRRAVDRLFSEGKLLMYAVNEDRTRWWCSINASDEFAALEVLGEMPLVKFLNPKIHNLMFYNGSEQVMPSISLN